MRRENNTLSPVLRSAWDWQTLEVMTRGKSKLKVRNAHISIIDHITPEELAKLLAQSMEIANGFANRFLWCHVSRQRLLPHGGDASVLQQFTMPLREAIANAKNLGILHRDAEANRLWESVYEGLTEARSGAFGQATQRARAQAMRLALIYAAIDGSPTIAIAHLKAALALWAYCEDSARLLFGGAKPKQEPNKDMSNYQEPLLVRLLNAIVQKPGIHRSELTRAFRPANADAIAEALASLMSQCLAYPKHEATDGRTAEAWYPGDGISNDDDCESDDEAEAKPSESPALAKAESHALAKAESIGIACLDGRKPCESLPFLPTKQCEAKAKAQSPCLSPLILSRLSMSRSQCIRMSKRFMPKH